MPANRFAFAVGVSGQHKRVSVFNCFGNLAQTLARIALFFPRHGEVIIGVNRAVFLRQIAHMAEARQNRKVRAEILIDGFRLSGRLNNNDLHKNAPNYVSGASYGRNGARCQIAAFFSNLNQADFGARLLCQATSSFSFTVATLSYTRPPYLYFRWAANLPANFRFGSGAQPCNVFTMRP